MHFWEGMGSSFTSPTCPPQSLVSEWSGGGFPVLMSVEIPLAVPSALLLLLFPMAEPWLSTDRAKAPPCKHKARDQGCNNRLHLLLWQCVPHMCEIRALSCLSDPLSKGCARWSQQIFWWCYMWLGISSVQWQLGRDESWQEHGQCCSFTWAAVSQPRHLCTKKCSVAARGYGVALELFYLCGATTRKRSYHCPRRQRTNSGPGLAYAYPAD